MHWTGTWNGTVEWNSGMENGHCTLLCSLSGVGIGHNLQSHLAASLSISRFRPNSFNKSSKVPLEVVKEGSAAAVACMSSPEPSVLGAACTDSIPRRVSERMLSIAS